jgi:hypothetical protein
VKISNNFNLESVTMAFKNEKISEQDQEWVSKLVNYNNIRAISRWVHRFSPPDWIWTVDRQKGAYLISLGGGGSPDDEGRMPYMVMIFDGEVVVFNKVERSTGNGTVGIQLIVEIHELIVPPALESRREEIKLLLHEALEEYTYCKPTADGGTWANPNLVARWNIKSFKVEFK